MPTGFLDFNDTGQSFADDAGAEFGDLEVAKAEAVRSLMEMTARVLPGGTHRELRITVRDESGLTGSKRSSSSRYAFSTRRHVPGLRSVARPFVRLKDEGCSDGPSRSSRTEGEPWESIAKYLSRLM
jgi:hypothetical protein